MPPLSEGRCDTFDRRYDETRPGFRELRFQPPAAAHRAHGHVCQADPASQRPPTARQEPDETTGSVSVALGRLSQFAARAVSGPLPIRERLTPAASGK